MLQKSVDRERGIIRNQEKNGKNEQKKGQMRRRII
jgi:hypothetical protein